MGVNVGGAGCCCFRAVGVDGVAEFLGGLEEGDALGGDFHLGTGFGVASDAGVALAGAEAAEAADFDLVSGFKGFDDRLKEGFDDDFAIAACEVAEGCDFIDEVSFSHERSPFGLVLRIGKRIRSATDESGMRLYDVDCRWDDGLSDAESYSEVVTKSVTPIRCQKFPKGCYFNEEAPHEAGLAGVIWGVKAGRVWFTCGIRDLQWGKRPEGGIVLTHYAVGLYIQTQGLTST